MKWKFWRKPMVREKLDADPPMRHEPTLSELEQALRIDTLDLMTADAAQPELFYRVAKMLASLKAEHDGLKLALDYEEARAQQAIRDAAGDTKMTVGQVDAMVRLQPAIKALHEQIQKINHIAGAAQALKEAYSQRKSSLSDLVELQRQAGTPVDPAVVRASMGEQRKGYQYPAGRKRHGE